MSVEIPLFPLGIVLFPHMPLPLHIFEERYRAMMRDCQASGIGFGVVAIHEGAEVGPPAVPHPVGTLAQLRRVERLDDGRYIVEVVGTSRYRIRSISTARPYPVAEVDYLEDDAGDGRRAGALAASVGAAFRRYVELLGARPGEGGADAPEIPAEPELLSYLVAARLEVETRHKQRLLEIDSAEERLRLSLKLLRRELALLERHLARARLPVARVNAN